MTPDPGNRPTDHRRRGLSVLTAVTSLTWKASTPNFPPILRDRAQRYVTISQRGTTCVKESIRRPLHGRDVPTRVHFA